MHKGMEMSLLPMTALAADNEATTSEKKFTGVTDSLILRYPARLVRYQTIICCQPIIQLSVRYSVVTINMEIFV